MPESVVPAQIDAPLIDAPQLTAIHMLDAVNGWGLAETAVVRTNDGGVTWYNLTPPGLTQVGYSVSEAFLDAQHAWIIVADPGDFRTAGLQYRTEDGGLHWSKSAVPFGSGHLTFLDATSGWMLADRGVAAGSNAVSVFQTKDGGSTWDRKYINDPTVEGARDSLPLGGLKFGLFPLNMQTAWIGGVVYAPGTVYLYRSDDAGHSWQVVDLSLPPGVQDSELAFEDLQFVDAQHAFLTLRITGNEYHLAVYVSSDGGDTWSLTPLLIPNGGSADFVSAQEGLVWNGDQFYVTRDAAQTWTTVAPDVVFGDTFARMDFVRLADGWVITYDSTSRYGLYRTADGGATWTSLFP
ncbi:MAG TPA: sialidase family protein [Anaerolineales bacterium]